MNHHEMHDRVLDTQREATRDGVPPAEPASPTVSLRLRVNGLDKAISVDPRTTLLDALREHLRLAGTKKGCDHGQCGACTVLLNGRRINSCLTLAVMHEGDEITTVEGLGSPDNLHPPSRFSTRSRRVFPATSRATWLRRLR